MPREEDVRRIVSGGRARGLSDDRIRALVARYDERQAEQAQAQAPPMSSRQRGDLAHAEQEFGSRFILPQSTTEGDPGYLNMALKDPWTFGAHALGNVVPSAGRAIASIPGMLATAGRAIAGPQYAVENGQAVLDLVEGYKDRYGGAENIARSVATDPVGVGLDVATLASGVKAGAPIARGAAQTAAARVANAPMVTRGADALIALKRGSPTGMLGGLMGEGPITRGARGLSDFLGPPPETPPPAAPAPPQAPIAPEPPPRATPPSAAPEAPPAPEAAVGTLDDQVLTRERVAWGQERAGLQAKLNEQAEALAYLLDNKVSPEAVFQENLGDMRALGFRDVFDYARELAKATENQNLIEALSRASQRLHITGVKTGRARRSYR